MSSVLIALLILLGIIQTPDEAVNLSQEQIEEIENTIIMDDLEV